MLCLKTEFAMALAAAPTDPLAVDVLFPGGQLLFSARGADIRVAGAWPRLRSLAPPTTSSGADAIGSFEATSAKYTAAGTVVELSVRRYADANAIAFEQRFPQGATPRGTGRGQRLNPD